MTFTRFTAPADLYKSYRPKRASLKKARSKRALTPLQTAIARTLLGTLCGMAVLQPGSSAIAADTPSTQSLETFRASDAVNSVICITACNEFFEAGRASFESEIQRLQNRSARLENSAPVLDVDPSLIRTLEEQRDAESQQNL
ncbi:MAG: hypothetical protein WA947_06860 [Phormidesmis sp.]